MSLQVVAPAEEGLLQAGFFPAAPDSKWYENLKRYGSCTRLFELLKEDPSLIHELGREDMTVLHKGVRHGCVALVKFILVDMFDDRGLCTCSRHGADSLLPGLTREQLLRKTCSYGSTAVNMAVVSGSPKMVVLLEWAINMCELLSGQMAQEISRDEVEDSEDYRTPEAFRCRLMKEKGREEEIPKESTNITGNVKPVPEVSDDALSMLYLSKSVVKDRVIAVIEGVLRDPGDGHRQWMDTVKEWITVDVDFEFVPLAHVFLHFLYSVDTTFFNDDEFNVFRRGVTKRILEACGDGDGEHGESDGEDGESGSMLTTLFNILDPRGRTCIHVALEVKNRTIGCDFGYIKTLLANFPPLVKVECLKARDGAGRSIFHLMAIQDDEHPFKELCKHVEDRALLERLSPPQAKTLDVLKKWCFPIGWDPNLYRPTPLHTAVLVNGRIFFSSSIWLTHGSICPMTWIDEWDSCSTTLQLAAILGRAGIREDMLTHHTKLNSLRDIGLGNMKTWYTTPAIHYAALNGQVEAIQSILKFPIYDPMVQNPAYGTALHLLLDKQMSEMDLNSLHNALLCHVLPNSTTYKRVKNDFTNLSCKGNGAPRMYSSNDISCINLLLQAGIDIWTPHNWTKGLPSPGPMANDEARKWWYEKVVSEVVALKTSVSYAANATSVVAALVATASFIGPFQPPLGYGALDGFVRTDRSPLRVYLVCNSLSFYFSIASILMAVLPAIPMPKESLYDELLRSQRCLKGAALMLLVSISCLLISFSSASMAVVSPEWHERKIVVGCVIFGGMICVVVLVIYVIRMLRMLFHRNDRFRRMFARHMYF